MDLRVGLNTVANKKKFPSDNRTPVFQPAVNHYNVMQK